MSRQCEPFGKPFRYTDPHDLPGDFQQPGAAGRHQALRSLPWYKRWFHSPRRPIAWAVTGGAVDTWVEADITPPGHPKPGLVTGGGIVPVYDEAIIIAAADAARERDE